MWDFFNSGSVFKIYILGNDWLKEKEKYQINFDQNTYHLVPVIIESLKGAQKSKLSIPYVSL